MRFDAAVRSAGRPVRCAWALAIALVLGPGVGLAQEEAKPIGTDGPVKELFVLDHMDVSPALRDMPVIPPGDVEHENEPVRLLHPPRPVGPESASGDPV